MAATKSTSELKSLQQRVADLESQLQALKILVDSRRPQAPILDRSWSKEDARAYDESAKRVQKIIEKNREADRRQAAAEYDRLHGRPKKASSAKQKPTKQAVRVRRAG